MARSGAGAAGRANRNLPAPLRGFRPSGMPVRSTELVPFECVDRFWPARVYRRPEESAVPGNVRYSPYPCQNILNLSTANRNRCSERHARECWPVWKEVSGMTDAGDFMSETDASTGSGQPRPEHQFWLAMQAAHAQWVNATEALDYLIAATPSDVPSPDERLRIARAAEEQRIRFEEYIEARLAFSEFQSAQFQSAQIQSAQLQSARDGGAGTESADGEDSEQGFHEIALGPWTLRTTSKFALAALAIALLCPAVFGLTYVMHERKQVRDLEAAREAMSAMLTQAPSQTQLAAP